MNDSTQPDPGTPRLAHVALAVKLSLALAGVLLTLSAPSSSATGRGSAVAAPASVRLTYSTASNHVVQPQPAPGSCHTIGSGLYSRPDRTCTPGALNPRVRQATIRQTICARGWTSTVRPPESVTQQEKRASLAAYGDQTPIYDYEYDHFVPLELGGATNDRRNLWPEQGAVPNPKDAVENELRRKVCDGQMTLAAAQRAIVANWVSLAPGPATTSPSPDAADAVVGRHLLGDRAVHQPLHRLRRIRPLEPARPDRDGERPRGPSASWDTDSAGYADVYFHGGSSAAGEQVTVRVGGATCTTTL